MLFIMPTNVSSWSHEHMIITSKPTNYSASAFFLSQCSIFQINPRSSLDCEQMPVSRYLKVLCASETQSNQCSLKLVSVSFLFYLQYKLASSQLNNSTWRLTECEITSIHCAVDIARNNIHRRETAFLKFCQLTRQAHHLMANSSTKRNQNYCNHLSLMKEDTIALF